MEKAILDSLNTPLFVTDQEGKIIYGNPSASRFWRIPSAKLLKYDLSQLLSAEERVIAAVRRAVATDASSIIDPVYIQSENGLSQTILRIQVDPLQIPNHPTEHAILLLWDETRREQLESASQEHRVRQSMGQMIKGLAHELQNPLSGIKGATQLLARKLDGVSNSEFPVVILKELERLERLIKNLLAYGDNPPLNQTIFNLHALLDEVLWFISNSNPNVEMVRRYDPSLPDCRADRDRLHQVFLNLLQNAEEASPPAGKISIRTQVVGPWNKNTELPDPAKIYFQIDIEDEGAGILEKDLERLYTPFFTSKPTGTGLGLSISHQIVMSHNGRLQYRHINDQGTVFSVIFPFME